jgi:pyruvate kinase
MNTLPSHKTKLVCTVGPATDSLEMIKKMIKAGMNIARLNFSHGTFESHSETIRKIRQASTALGQRIAIMADLPGPKMRIGSIADEPVLLKQDALFILSAEPCEGNEHKVSMSMETLPQAVQPGNTLFLNDGLIQLKVKEVHGPDIHCTVIMGGSLRSRKGLNIPGINLGTSAFTPRDHECMTFALEQGVDAISQSFVDNAQDILDVRKAAHDLGYDPFIIAKIERSSVREKIDSILEVTDGIMVARGDLGVEVPIEEIAVLQKFITARANFYGKPVITATQMLESMTRNRRPTRAEATDVANAILDGTDCVMLSEESAMGDYPIESIEMLGKIARATEPNRKGRHFITTLKPQAVNYKPNPVDMICVSIEKIIAAIDTTAAVLTPTASGYTACNLSRFRLPVWILAVSANKKTCQNLMFSYGVCPILETEHPQSWNSHAEQFVKQYKLTGSMMLQTEGPSPAHHNNNYKMEIIHLNQ